ncbi:MAG: CDP-glucose 4,6-dehydratase [Parcubacteria group bacterium Gr01-1014_56]|nr:MAG: CDP-glucose 4,6-dehydratase [Parcubacteria group bacterium Gr01-1014_56]
MELFNTIYKGKKVLITGHTGFKGSWLSLWLTRLGAHVVGYSIDVPTKPSHFKLLNLNITSITGDILDKRKLLQTVETHKPDIIFHMAAQPLVRLSYEEPTRTFETNITGTVNVLESCRKTRTTKAVLIITSDKCYQNKETVRGYQEDDAMGGDDPYSASKGCAELVTHAYRHSFFHPDQFNKTHSTLVATARAGNVIGGGDWAADRLIPDIMKAAAKKEKMSIRNPHAVRPWQHVLEPLSGYLQLGQKLLEKQREFADAWNFGPSEKAFLTAKEVTKSIKKHWHEIDFTTEVNRGSLHEATLLTLDSSKARRKLKWKSIWDTDTTFEQTTNWYKNFYTDGTILSEDNLDQYISDALRTNAPWVK